MDEEIFKKKRKRKINLVNNIWPVRTAWVGRRTSSHVFSAFSFIYSNEQSSALFCKEFADLKKKYARTEYEMKGHEHTLTVGHFFALKHVGVSEADRRKNVN